MGAQPGVMIYFDLKPIIKELSPEQAGVLFLTILEYAELGVLPDFAGDPVLRMAWACIQPKVDRDIETYRTKCEKNAYNQYKRWQQDKNLEVLPFDDWKKLQSNTPEYDGIGNVPTTTPKSTTKSTSTPNTTVTTKANAAEKEMDWVANRQAVKDALLNYGRRT